MDFITHIREALANLLVAKLTSLLAILGVLVGTGSVVALIASSQLATANALSQFKSLGTNLLALNIQNAMMSDRSSQKQQFRLSDVPRLIHSSNQIVAAAPYVNSFDPVLVNGVKTNSQVIGATEALFEIAKIYIAEGRSISYLDKYNFYCVIGIKLAKKFYDRFVDPLGKQIKVGNVFFTVVGVAKKWQPNLFLFVNVDRGVIIPIKTIYLLEKRAEINNVLLRLIQNPNIKKTEAGIILMFKERFPNKKAQFRSPEQIIQLVENQRKTFTYLLGAIGGIALIVGGIGVMNIMLVSVVERRREIGIRMAIGARQRDILSMFLIESIMLTVFGGILGILLGVAVSYILAITTGWGFTLYLLPPILGFVVSVIVGILSGYYPALRASRLDPIQCLQSD